MPSQSIKIKAKEICDKNNAFYPLFDALISKDKSVVTNDELLRDVNWGDSKPQEYAARKLTVDFFRELQRMDVGQFVAGRKGKKSRFIWNVAAPESGLKLPETIALVTSNQESPNGAHPPVSPDKIIHQFVLRGDFVAKIQLPRDFTKNEADRLARFVQTLPFENE